MNSKTSASGIREDQLVETPCQYQTPKKKKLLDYIQGNLIKSLAGEQ